MRWRGMIVLAVWCASWAVARAQEPALLNRSLSSWIADLSDSGPETSRAFAAHAGPVLAVARREVYPQFHAALAARLGEILQYVSLATAP